MHRADASVFTPREKHRHAHAVNEMGLAYQRIGSRGEAIRYLGIAPEELKIAEEGRDLQIYVERATQQQGPQGRAFSSSRMSRRVSLPADADVSQMQRQEGPGFVTLWVPRRMMMGPGPRW